MAWNIEVTDTFGGEANYCWVERFTVPSKDNETDLAIVRRCKKAANLNGVRCRTSDFGDGWRLDIVGDCAVAFIEWVEPEYSFHPDNAETA